MSLLPRRGLSRGQSIPAMLVFVGILALTAVSIQTTVPIESVPAAATIAAAATPFCVTLSGRKVCDNSKPMDDVLGWDLLILENLRTNTKGEDAGAQVLKIKVCDKPEESNLEEAKYTPSKSRAGEIHKGDRCNSDGTPKKPWKSFKVTCSAQVENISQFTKIDAETTCRDVADGAAKIDGAGTVSLDQLSSQDKARVKGLVEQVRAGTVSDQDVQTVLAQNPDLRDPFETLTQAEIDKTSEAVKAKESDLLNQKKTLETLDAMASNGTCGANEYCSASGLQAQKDKIAEAEIALNKANVERENLKRGATALDQNDFIDAAKECANMSPEDCQAVRIRRQSAPCNENPSGCGADIGNMAGRGGQTFGGGSGGNVSSPFGGQCVQRYVCSGNMLYYQTPSYQLVSSSPINTQSSCQTQPIQQCQYGCLNMNQGQQGGGKSSMGILNAVMSVFSAFSGGNSAQMPNQNLSNSCATQQQSQQQSQQQQAPSGRGNDGQACQQSPVQPDPSQCSSGSWKPVSASGNGCLTGYQCVPNSDSTGGQPVAPNAKISCQPKNVDAGMSVTIAFSCGNSDGSSGTGFDTKNKTSGSVNAVIDPPKDTSAATYSLTCYNKGLTASESCDVQVSRPVIILVANPKEVKTGEKSTIGWVTTGMKSCVISSPNQSDFNSRNAGNKNVNGAAQTSLMIGTSEFDLDCETLGGGSKSASTTVSIN